MSYIADLHIHSRYSLATSKELTPPMLHLWALRKGIGLVGTGDCIHPKWLAELEEMLTLSDDGFLRLKPDFVHPESRQAPDGDAAFVLTTEISNIYKRNGRLRKVHNVLIFPDFESAKRMQGRLQRMNFNISSDGRPILGLDSRDLLRMLLEVSEDAMLIPAHIWTPWFSALGSKSGFDSIEECYGELTRYIPAVETGLSSDAPMNWLIPSLDSFTLIANSDAHSPEKLGRNANRLSGEKNYGALVRALKEGPSGGFGGTIDMFPQEGKYHYAGHRKCGVVLNPAENLLHAGICPVCNRPLTEGVMDRIAQLAGRDNPLDRPNRAPFQYAIPLKEMLAQIHNCGEGSKTVTMLYNQIIKKIGPELAVLLDCPIEEIAGKASPLITEAIRRMRANEVIINEGYDGEYGVVKVFEPHEINEFVHSTAFFTRSESSNPPAQKPLLRFDPKQLLEVKEQIARDGRGSAGIKPDSTHSQPEPNQQQQSATCHEGTPALVLAGPGTGKTKVLTGRIAWLINEKGIPPEKILAITFTRKAAREMSDRIGKMIPAEMAARLEIHTFHNWGLKWLQHHQTETMLPADFAIAGEAEKRIIVDKCCKSRKDAIELINRMKQSDQPVFDNPEEEELLNKYNLELDNAHLVDIDDLVLKPLKLLKQNPRLLTETQQAIGALLVDEYQDVNAAQYELIRLLAADDPSKLFAIGDPNQSIYAFRGSEVAFIQRFMNDFTGATGFQLSQSYRCPQTVLSAAGQVLGPSAGNAISGIRKGAQVHIVENTSGASEAEFIARTVDKLTGGTRFFAIDSGVAVPKEVPTDTDPSQVAVFARTHRQLKTIAKALDDHGVPWRIFSHRPPFTQKPAADIITVLKAFSNPGNHFYTGQASLVCGGETRFRALLDAFPAGESVAGQIDYLIEHHFLKKRDELAGLIEAAKDFGDRKEMFWTYVATGSMIDASLPGITAVNLLTLHAGKGLEFDVVFIAGCEEGLIPYTIRRTDNTDIEEEKRLLYVGMTRARNLLFLTHAKERTIFGRAERLPRSGFLDAISLELLQREKQLPKQKATDNQLSLF